MKKLGDSCRCIDEFSYWNKVLMVDYSEWNDEKLLKEYRQGNDPRIVEILFTRHADVGFRVAMRFMKNEADAEDILQGAFIQFLRDLHQFREGVSVKPWLMKMIVNNCKDKYKEENRRIKREQKIVSERFLQKTSESLEVKHEDGNTELQKKLRQSVDELPEKYRSPIWLILYEEFSYREVATVLALPEKTIRTQVARGLEKLREKLSSIGSLLSVTMIIESINSSPLEEAPVAFKAMIQVDRLNKLANEKTSSSSSNLNFAKENYFFILLSSVCIIVLVSSFLYWQTNQSFANNKTIPIQSAINKIHLNFNTKDAIGDYAFMGEYNYLDTGGIDNSGCLEIPNAFSLRIPIKDLKLPLKITCRSNIRFDRQGIIGFSWLLWDSWENMGQFYDVSQYRKYSPRLGEYSAQKDEDWATETYYVTQKSIDAWIDNRRVNLYFVKQELQNEFLYLIFYNCTKKVDELVIETISETKIPSISEFEKIYIEHRENTDIAEKFLKKLLNEKGLNGLEPKYHFYSKQNKDDVIHQIKYKLERNQFKH